MTAERELPSTCLTIENGGDESELASQIRLVLAGISEIHHGMEVRDALMAIHEIATQCIAEVPEEVAQHAPWLTEEVLNDLRDDLESTSEARRMLAAYSVIALLQEGGLP